MKNSLLLFFILISSFSFAEEGILLFYPSYKWAEMSGGYPAEVKVQFYYKDIENKTDLITSQPVIHYEDNVNPSNAYDIQFLNHANFCSCNGHHERRQLPIIVGQSVIFVGGHYYEIAFLFKSNHCPLKSY